MQEIERHHGGVQHHADSAPLLTVEDVARRLADIHANRDDGERAHSMADGLYRDVLASIAAGASDAPTLAAAALRLETLDFARWCA